MKIKKRKKKKQQFIPYARVVDDWEAAARQCLQLKVGGIATFGDGSMLLRDGDQAVDFTAVPLGMNTARNVLGVLRDIELERIVANQAELSKQLAELEQKVHTPESRDDSGRFPVFTYSRLSAEDVEAGEEAGEESEESEGGESPEAGEGVEMWTPNLEHVEALHLCGKFMCWELDSGKLVLDDDGRHCAVHVFSCKKLALDVLRGRVRRRGLRTREGYVGGVRHSGDWESRVERLLG